MTDELAGLELLPLVFFTALVVYALVMGGAGAARRLIRFAALAAAAVCLAVWGAAALSYDDWGAPLIDSFYATTLIERQLGAPRSGWLLLALAALPLGFALRELWRRRSRQ